MNNQVDRMVTPDIIAVKKIVDGKTEVGQGAIV